ncbi:hypothetical protein N7481_003970 [Penicillium waksmanii]|uniref:uncharacterized protein n=1 Tax=Penicillium waksmanii TaxID=69791 RepID=UPI002548E6C6|nr:uncharacterized protein N7481_003970 [Penicillium waksmanii]KAJ5988760.1 hypothetical protein N7481_003970 [Penicillium waksmanii]
MSSTWHRLSLQTESLPSLLFQYTWTREGYELYLTDLTSIWSEQLGRQDIFKRAERGLTTIDPSEGDDQLELLLTKIGEALSGAGGKSALNSGSKANSIDINISAKLPAPLRPLKWTFQLSKEPTASLTSRILLPLLKDEAVWESRQQALSDQLQQKDWVLDKLFDRIEALGVDMSTIFPSASGIRSTRKGDMRSELAKLVKGVAPFDEKAWLAQLGGSSSTFSLASNLVHEIFGSNSKKSLMSFNPVRDHWWDELGTLSNTTSQEEADLAPKEKASRNLTEEPTKHTELVLDDGEDTAGTTDSEFERYEEPPRGKSPAINTKGSSPQPNPSSKELSPIKRQVEKELDSAPAPQTTKAPSSSPEPKPTAKPPKKAIGKLGVIGGKKRQQVEPRPPSPPQAPTPAPASPVKDSEPAHETAALPSPAKVKKPSRLGVIGGKSKAKRQETPPPEPPTLPPAHQSPTKPPKREYVSPERTVKGPSKKEKSADPPVKAPPEVPETEEEKARRRREELKRQMEAQSKAPAKKKRRF